MSMHGLATLPHVHEADCGGCRAAVSAAGRLSSTTTRARLAAMNAVKIAHSHELGKQLRRSSVRVQASREASTVTFKTDWLSSERSGAKARIVTLSVRVLEREASVSLARDTSACAPSELLTEAKEDPSLRR